MMDARDYVEYGVGQGTNKGTAYNAYMGLNSYLNNGTNFKDFESKFDNLMGGTVAKQDARILETFKRILL